MSGDSSTLAYSIGAFIAYFIIFLAMWKMFTKAGQAGWKTLIPFYNTYILSKIATGGWLTFVLLLIPGVNFFAMIYLNYKIATAYGHGLPYTLGLIFFNPIFTIILGFGSSRYIGPQ